MTVLFIGLTSVAIFISKNRRTIIIKISLLYSGIMLVTVIGLRFIKMLITNNTSSDYSSAATTAYSIVTKSFYIQSITILVLGLIIALVAWISGEYKSAKRVKKISNKLLSGNIHKAIFKHENSYTKFIGKNRKIINWASVVIAAILLCFVGISLTVLVTYFIVIILVIFVVEISSASPKS